MKHFLIYYQAFYIITTNNDYFPRNTVDSNRSKIFSSVLKQNSWLKIDFICRKVHPTHYSIQTWELSKGNHIQNWVIEGSNDNSSWQVLDEERDCNELHGNDLVHTFPIKNQTIKPKIASNGKNTPITPTLVATPFPPSNFKKGEKQCPITAKKAIIHCAS